MTTKYDELTRDLILILPYGRSGSYFLQCLLDSHDQLICFPPVYTASYLNAFKENSQSLTSAEQMYEYLCQYYEGLYLGNYEFSQNQTIMLAEVINMPAEMPFSNANYKEVFIALHKKICSQYSDPVLIMFLTMCHAYDIALNGYEDERESFKKRIVFQLHRADFYLMNWFSGCFGKIHVTHMVRSPLIGFRSSVKYSLMLREKYNIPFQSKHLESYFKYLFFTGTPFSKSNVDHFAIRLESLHQSPEATLRKLAKRLGISFNERLLSSTFAGRTWTNFQGKEELNHFMPEKVREYTDIVDIVPEQDARRLGKLLHSRYKAWNYEHDYRIMQSDDEQCQEHFFLVEYLPYFDSPEKALTAYRRQVPLLRSANTNFMLRYMAHADLNFVELL